VSSYLGVKLASAGIANQRSSTAEQRSAALDFSALYDTWFEHVVRWLRALGAPEAEQEDLAQEVFLIVRRKLPSFDGRNVPGWLFQIARRQVLRYRRLRWVQRVFALGNDEELELPEIEGSPLSLLETKERAALVDRLLAELSEKRRVVFALFEIEGYSGEEIAELLDTPVNTVWTRLHHARKDFYQQLARHTRAESGASAWKG